MEDYLNTVGLCHVCKESISTIHAEIVPRQHIYVCEKCLELAKQNFIWICMHCGSVFIRPKSLVLARLRDPEMKHALFQCKDEQIIQGIDMCVECDPEDIMETAATARKEKNSGYC
jgi:hypothetical protein